MTVRGRLSGFGKDLTITRGDVTGFLGYNFAILVFITGCTKEDIRLSEGTGNYLNLLFQPANLGQFGFTYYHFLRLMRVFELPTYEMHPTRSIRSENPPMNGTSTRF